MKKLAIYISFIILFFAASASIPNKSLAENDSEDIFFIETKNDQTVLRAGAGSGEKIIITIPKNQKAVVLDEFANPQNEQWLKVQYGKAIGWIKRTEIQTLETKDQYITSLSDQAAIRAGAAANDKQIGSLPKGQLVKVIDTYRDENREKWVRINNGKVTGWTLLKTIEVFYGEKNYLSKSSFVQKDTIVRGTPSHNGTKAYTLKKGVQLNLLSFLMMGNGETWYQIKDGQKSGWVPASHLSHQMNLNAFLYIKDPIVEVRYRASSSYKVVANLSVGQRVKVTSKYINQKNELWYSVVFGNAKTGWVIGKSLTADKIKVAYLTVDDGPTAYTNQLLDILKKYDAKATFFMVNGKMNTYSNVMKRMVKEGHAVGSHSVTHDKSKFYRSPSSAVNEMVATRNTIKQITGINSNLIRVPYGSVPYMKQSYRDAMNKQSFIMWDWNIDSLDWKYKSSGYVKDTLDQVKKIDTNGGTPYILIHDLQTTINHLPSLITSLKKQGYTLVPLTENIPPHQFK